MADIILDKKFVCTDSAYGKMGHNKFWNIRVYSDGTLETEYGRVGDPGTSTHKSFCSEEKALREAEKLIKKKERGKSKKDGSTGRDSQYKEVEIVGSVSHNQRAKRSIGKRAWVKIAQGDKEIEALISLLDRENIHNITSGTTLTYDETTGLFSTPLGVVGQNSIDEARNILSKMRTFVKNRDFSSEGNKLAEEFMMIIPQNVGRRRPTLDTICPDLSKLDEHNSILDSLQASLDIVMKPKGGSSDSSEELEFGVTLSALSDHTEITRLECLFSQTKQNKHVSNNLKLKKVFIVDHEPMKLEFVSKGKPIGNIMELWHGTRVGNILSILTKGMYIPLSTAAHCTGRMFGNGAYFFLM